ncbi:MAG: DUF1993 domain-containing protein [Polyangiales bacterium]
MLMSLYEASVPVFTKFLRNLDKWLDKAEAHAKSKNFDTSVFLSARLAPDQFAFVRQVHIATDSSKLGAARIAGKQAPAFEDKETTLAELKERIAKTVAFLETLKPSDFEGAGDRKVTLQGGKTAIARDHLFDHVLPTFFFHVTTAYAILRHNGVDLGKKDYLGPKREQEG